MGHSIVGGVGCDGAICVVRWDSMCGEVWVVVMRLTSV